MKVAFFAHYHDQFGANRSLLNFFSGIADFNIEPLVVVPQRGELSAKLRSIGVPYIIEDYRWWMLEARHYPHLRRNVPKYIRALLRFKRRKRQIELGNQRQALTIAKRLADFNPDVIYSNSSVINVGFLVSRLTKTPHLWHLREFGQDDYNLRFISRKKEVRRQLRQSEKTIGVSKAICAHWGDFTGNAPCLVYNGVIKTAQIQIGSALGRRPVDGALKFGILGLLRKNKGQAEAIRAFAEVVKKYPHAELRVGGDGPDKAKLLRMVENGGIPNIAFTGYVDDPFDFFNRVDVGLVCSPKEGLGKVTLEAMATGTPVIGLDNAGTGEIIVHQNNGLLYSTSQDLVGYMLKLCAKPQLITDYGNRAKDTVLRQFTIEDYVQSIYTHLTQLSGLN